MDSIKESRTEKTVSWNAKKIETEYDARRKREEMERNMSMDNERNI